MTANCPKCGGKWDVMEYGGVEGCYRVYIPEGDRIEIVCTYCNTSLEYNLCLEQIKKLYLEDIAQIYKVIENLSDKAKKEFYDQLTQSIIINKIIRRGLTK